MKKFLTYLGYSVLALVVLNLTIVLLSIFVTWVFVIGTKIVDLLFPLLGM